MDVIRINSLTLEDQATQQYWVKRRNPGSRWVIAGANAFFRAVRNPVFVFADAAAWQAWEVRCFSSLNGDRFAAFSCHGAVWTANIPGKDLARLALQHQLGPVPLVAAGAEFHRMHDLWSAEFGAKWSHGDPHLGNVIFEAGTGRARLIDFEVTHLRTLTALQRHADDLKVFLLDLLGRSSDEDWPGNARVFLKAYGCDRVLNELRRNFVMPYGSERVWWAIRTSYLPGVLLRRRVLELQAAMS